MSCRFGFNRRNGLRCLGEKINRGDDIHDAGLKENIFYRVLHSDNANPNLAMFIFLKQLKKSLGGSCINFPDISKIENDAIEREI